MPSVWAVGDVTNRIPLTPVARMEGLLLAQHIFKCACVGFRVQQSVFGHRPAGPRNFLLLLALHICRCTHCAGRSFHAPWPCPDAGPPVCRNNPDARPQHQLVPSVVFSSPEVAVIGLTEQAAAEKHKNIAVYSSSFTCALFRGG